MAAARRQQVLQALGLTPWVRRARGASAGSSAAAVAEPSPSGRCVVLIPAGADVRAMDLLGRALNACGAELARAGRISVADGAPGAPVPHAPVYLAFGQAQAHALGRELPAAVMREAHIALVDDPSQLLVDAGSKRRLWAALRQVRRALAATRGH
ncbi:hypothetical protein [Dyella sp.]|uniref:hypothetical protein n=1 Tax=Dyella sp. TaxID=1869338 RepID=UPI002D79609C|nr:hypothetical protein [Dyella sp.]HET6430930.1 hypothetical protein [Dyella sp.]